MKKKVMQLNSYKDGASFWRVACDCTDSNHDVELWFEPEDSGLILNMSIEVGFHPRYQANFFERTWVDFQRRISAAASILFRGRFVATGDVMLDQDGIAAMQYALEQGQQHAQNCQQARQNKNSNQ